jgi:hypothetical protein
MEFMIPPVPSDTIITAVKDTYHERSDNSGRLVVSD